MWDENLLFILGWVGLLFGSIGLVTLLLKVAQWFHDGKVEQ